MKIAILLLVTTLNLQCMESQKVSISTGIENILRNLEVAAFKFTAMQKAYAPHDRENIIFQFQSSDPEDGIHEAIFIKENDGDRISQIILSLDEDDVLNFSNLEKEFGEFRHAPPSPARVWSALAAYPKENQTAMYTLIVSANTQIRPETKIEQIKIRVEYKN